VTELIVDATLHRTKRWILIPLTVGHQFIVYMVLDTGTPFSGISEGTREGLVRLGLLGPAPARAHVLRDLEIQGQSIPDLPVLLSRRVTQVGAEGALGLDFLRSFSDVHFHVPTLRLTLTGP
jgi:hypothetical protein